MLVLTFGSVAAVLWRVWPAWRRAAHPGERGSARTAAAVAGRRSACASGCRQGPLAGGWARRAGTPTSVLTAFNPPTPAAPRRREARSRRVRAHVLGGFNGPLRQGTSASGPRSSTCGCVCTAAPTASCASGWAAPRCRGGGLSMQRSAVTLGPPGRARRSTRAGCSSCRTTCCAPRSATRTGERCDSSVNLSVADDSVDGTVSGRPLA